METRVLVTALNEHRNNLQEVDLFCVALDRLNISYTNKVVGNYDIAIVWPTMDANNNKKLETIKTRCAGKVYYVVVDSDMPIPDGVETISQFKDTRGIYFPISALIVFHMYWSKPIYRVKAFDTFYGGTYKPRRDYSKLRNTSQTLVCSDDNRFEEILPHATHMPVIRDMDVLYHTMALCKATYVLPDAEEGNANIPLRFYEGVLTNTDIIHYSGETYTPSMVKSLISQEEMLWNTQRLMLQIS